MPATPTQITPKPDDPVSFVVVCRPKSGATLNDFREKMNAENVSQYLPDKETKQEVIRSLRGYGFTVYEVEGSAIVSASGTVSQFEQVFRTTLTGYRHSPDPSQGNVHQEFCAISENARAADASVVPGALLVTVSRPPVMFSAFPPGNPSFHLRHAGDIAVATKASLVHRKKLMSGDRATGGGVVIAMVDTGFVNTHRFYEGNAYDLRPVAIPGDARPPTDDPQGHGTRHASDIFACAPDATVYGIRMGEASAALSYAAALGATVVSCSWGNDLEDEVTLPDDQIGLLTTVYDLVSRGITLVFSAGNNKSISFPAMMREVIAVGGVAVDKKEVNTAYSKGSSFTSPIFPGRSVPDLCGVASKMAMPTSIEDDPSLWEIDDGMTSAAAPQVAGVVALLLQKDSTLTPAGIRDVLRDSARDVTSGSTSTRDTAEVGWDQATGSGLVNALDAWNRVVDRNGE